MKLLNKIKNKLKKQSNTIIEAEEQTQANAEERTDTEKTAVELQQELIKNAVDTKVNDVSEAETVNEENYDQLFEHDEGISENIKEEFNLAGIGADSEDIDSAIEELLKADAATELTDIDYNYIQDVSVYDTIRNDKEAIMLEAQKAEEEILQENIEKEIKYQKLYMFFYIITGIFIIIVIALCVVFFVFANNAAKEKIALQHSKAAIVSQPSYKANNANFIYLTQKEKLGEENIELNKMLIDSVATIFYFKNNMNTQLYNFTLTDDRGKLYNMDLYFVENGDEDGGSTVIRFEPLGVTARAITLDITNPETSESAVFKINFEKPIETTPVSSLKTPVSEVRDGYTVSLNSLILSSAGSTLEYSFETEAGQDFTLSHGFKNNSDYIKLEEGSSPKVKIKNKPLSYDFNDGKIMLGRMDFDTVKNLDSKMYVTFEDIYKKYSTNYMIPASAVSGSGTELEHTIKIGNYNIVCEGLRAFNDQYVFVFHGEDATKPYDASNPEANRIETVIDAQLIAQTPSGMEVVLDGSCNAGTIGTDMLFPVNDYARDFIYNVSRENLKVHIKSILIKADDVKFEVSSKKLGTSIDNKRQEAIDSIEAAFESRLKYKSDNAVLDAITGFDSEVLYNQNLMSHYEPQELTEKPIYSAQVMSLYINGDNCMAIVQETWQGINGKWIIPFYRTHKVFAYKTSIGYNIKNDIIVK